MSDLIRPEQIPDEVVEAAEKVINRYLVGALTQSEGATVGHAVVAAALAAWPGALVEWHSRGPGIILPLPEAPQERGVSTENSND